MKISTSLAVMLMLRWSLASFCQRLSENEAYLGPIEMAKNALKSNPKCTVSFHPAILKMCATNGVAIKNEKENNETLLGSGAFGRVFKIRVDGQGASEGVQAVKEVNMAAMICKRIEKQMAQEEKSGLDVFTECQKVITNSFEEFLEEDKIDNTQDIIKRFKDKCSIIEVSKESETPESKILRTLQIVAETKFDNVFDRFQTEVQIFSKYSAKDQADKQLPLFAPFHKCLVGSDLTMYIITDVLGPSLASLLGTCSSSLYNKDLAMQLALAMEIVLPVAEMHEKNDYHCDLKPGNYIFSNQFMASLYVSDFGEAQQKNSRCLRGTKGYYLKDSCPKDKAEIDFPSLAFSKQDVFSLGMILMEVTRGKIESEKWRNLAGEIKENPNKDSFINQFKEEVKQLTSQQKYPQIEAEEKSNELNVQINAELTLLILNMLNLNYKERPLVIEVLAEIYNLFMRLLNSSNVFDEEMKKPVEKSELTNSQNGIKKREKLIQFARKVIEIKREERIKAVADIANEKEREKPSEISVEEFMSCYDPNAFKFPEDENGDEGDGSNCGFGDYSFSKLLI